MRIVRNNIIPFKGFKAVNLFGVLFCRKDTVLDKVDLAHEEIHTQQMREMLYIFYYIWYGIEWLIRFIIYWDCHKAYKLMGFELEAYFNQYYPDYLGNRKHYAWIKYL